MVKQVTFLFVRALIIGVILNLGIHYASGSTTTVVSDPQSIEQILSTSDIQAQTSINPE